MWQRECLPPKTLISPRRLHRIRGRYAALRTLVRRAYIQRRTGTGQLLFPFSKYAPVTTRFPVHKPATIKLTHYLFGLWQPIYRAASSRVVPAAGQRGTGSSKEWTRAINLLRQVVLGVPRQHTLLLAACQ